MAVPLRESVRKRVFPHDGRTADEKPGNVPPYADDGHRYPLSSFSHDGIAMVRKPGVTMPAFSALPHRATLSLVLSRNEPLMPPHPLKRGDGTLKKDASKMFPMRYRLRYRTYPDQAVQKKETLPSCKRMILIRPQAGRTHRLEERG